MSTPITKMLKIFSCFLFFLLIHDVSMSQEICQDSMISTEYQKDGEQYFDGFVNENLREGGNITGFLVDNVLEETGIPGLYGFVLLKTDNFGRLIWGRRLSVNMGGIRLTSLRELQDGGILFSGNVEKYGNYYSILGKTDRDGKIKWINFYEENNVFFTITNLIESPGEDIEFSGKSGNDLIVTKMDSLGTHLWTKAYKFEKPQEFFDNFSCSWTRLSDSSCVLGFVFYWNYDIRGLYSKPSLILFSINDKDGAVIKSKVFNSTTKGMLLPVKIENSESGLNVMGEGSLNGDFILNSLFINEGFEITGNLTIRGRPVVNLLFDQSYSSTEEEINCTQSLTGDGNTAYFFSFDKNLKISGFKKFPLKQGFVNLNYYKNGDRANLVTLYSNSLEPHFTIANFPSSFSGNSECFGTDTSSFFSPVSPLTFTTSPAAISQTSFLLNPVKSGIEITPSDYEISRTEDCKEVSICDSIRIKGPETICDPDKSMEFHIEKRMDCLKEIDWDIDSSAIEKMEFQGKDSVKILFEKGWKGGYLRAAIPSCNIRDSIMIIVSGKLPSLNLGADTSLCRDSIVLRAQQGYKDYQWQNGNTDDSMVVYSPGRYWVQVNDGCGESFADTIIVSAPDLYFSAGSSKSICEGDTATLSATEGFQNYRWMPDVSVSDPYRANVNVFPDSTTRYIVSAEKFTGCFVGDSVTVEVKDCPLSIFFPNAFSPNNDGLNDLFRPVISRNPKNFKISVFNRNGRLIYYSERADEGWDGRYKGELQPAGVYVWTCEYSFPRQKPHRLKGELVLLK